MVCGEMVKLKVDTTSCVLHLQGCKRRIVILDDETGEGVSEELRTVAGLRNRESKRLDSWPFCDLDLRKCGRQWSASGRDDGLPGEKDGRSIGGCRRHG